MSLEGAHQPQCLLIEPSWQANSVIIKTINQKTRVHTQKSSNSPGKCYKPISYSIDIQCCIIGIDYCLRSTSFVFRRVVDVICVIFFVSGSIFRLFWSLQLWSISFIPWIPLIYAFFLNVIVILLKPRHMSDHNWIKSKMWQSPPKRGTFLYHIWQKSQTWQSPPKRGTFFCTTFGQSPRCDKVLQWGAYF